MTQRANTTKMKQNEYPEEKNLRLYKTEICRNWEEKNECLYGEKCKFAHGTEELRYVERHRLYKTVICQKYSTSGTCPYGPRCTYIHESPPSPNLQASLDSITSDLSVNSTAPPSETVSSSFPPPPSVLASPYQQSAQYADDMTLAPLHQHRQQFINPSVSALPRLSISSFSSSSSSSSSILSASSPAIFSSISQQLQLQEYPHLNDFCHRDDYLQQRSRYRLPGYCTIQDLLSEGSGFHSALGVTPPSLTLPTFY